MITNVNSKQGFLGVDLGGFAAQINPHRTTFALFQIQVILFFSKK